MDIAPDFGKSDYKFSPDSSDNEEEKKGPEVIEEEDEYYDEEDDEYYDEEDAPDPLKAIKSPPPEGVTPVVNASSGYIVKPKSSKTSSNASEVSTPAIVLPPGPWYKPASPKPSKHSKTASNPSLGRVKSIEEEEKKSSIVTSKASTKGKRSPAGSIKSNLESVGSKPVL